MNHPSISHHYGQDHDRLDDLFRQFQALKLSDRESAGRAFQEFKAGLERHIAWEEEILFPAFENKTGQTSGPTQVMRL
jgi:iron-sulfur cluster repair protein YtfE (RIC family)